MPGPKHYGRFEIFVPIKHEALSIKKKYKVYKIYLYYQIINTITNNPGSVVIMIYLNVSYDQKDHAKSLGAKWDAQKKKWYAPDESFTELIEAFSSSSCSSSSSSSAASSSSSQKSVRINKMPYGTATSGTAGTASASASATAPSKSKISIHKADHPQYRQQQQQCSFEDDDY
jgi:hypothetical protein